MPTTQTITEPTLITKEGVRIFGIRHLSPAGAWHLLEFLDRVKPQLVLVESPSDTTPLIDDLTRPGVKPPVAVLCYTAEVPVQSILYPLAVYSPEYQAAKWAKTHRKTCRFIDLPSSVKTQLSRLQEQLKIDGGQRAMPESTQEDSDSGEDEAAAEAAARVDFYRFQKDLYDQLVRLSGESDFETYWERSFEHNLEPDAYRRGVAIHSAQLRDLAHSRELEADPLAAAINALRESYMKRQICDAIAEGIPPEKIVVVCGAYHVSGLMENDPMTDREFAGLPRRETRMTLMPYSYYRLGSFAGYGAGNNAPYYYEMMWNAMTRGDVSTLAADYLAGLGRVLRQKHGYSSTATVIEAVRLAQGLQHFHGGLAPTLRDLHDAAVTCMGGGELSAVADGFAAMDVGTRIGSLPDNVSQTPIQDDMNRSLKTLKLEQYKSVVAQDLALDLRENRQVKTEAAAFLDLNRSTFLHRLALLDIGFARSGGTRQDSATWAENWVLCWTPEVEIAVVEAVLFGDTIEAAASYVLKEKLESATDVLEVAALVRRLCECQLPASLHDALKKLQSLTSDSENFVSVASAAREMSSLIQYGNLRRFDTDTIKPILQQLFLKGALILYGSASCSDDAAREIAGAMTLMHFISQEHDDIVSDETWLARLDTLAHADDRNPMLCGYAFSILLERGRVGEEQLATQVSRHLSPGNTPEAGAGWFEGLSRRNRYVLLSRNVLWQQLDTYLQQLDDEQFKRALVCLRRAFASFEPAEKSGICDILAELWGVDAAEFLQEELTEEENAAMDSLSDFDFEF